MSDLGPPPSVSFRETAPMAAERGAEAVCGHPKALSLCPSSLSQDPLLAPLGGEWWQLKSLLNFIYF